jgi:hypothetical protein
MAGEEDSPMEDYGNFYDDLQMDQLSMGDGNGDIDGGVDSTGDMGQASDTSPSAESGGDKDDSASSASGWLTVILYINTYIHTIMCYAFQKAKLPL